MGSFAVLIITFIKPRLFDVDFYLLSKHEKLSIYEQPVDSRDNSLVSCYQNKLLTSVVVDSPSLEILIQDLRFRY